MKKQSMNKLLVFFGFVGAGLLVYFAIVAYPVLYSLWLSFTNFNPNRGGEWNFVGMEQYVTMLQDPNFWHALKNNMIVVLVSVFGQIPIAFVLAYILYRGLVRATHFFQAVIFLPQFLSVIVIGLLWKRFFSADGPIAALMQWYTGDPTTQFTLMLDSSTIMYPIGFALIWVYTGFFMIVFLANLQKIESTVIESATIDGASESQILRHVIVPHMAGTIIICSILAIAGSLKGFELIFGMTTQGLQRNNAMVLPIFMYQTAFQDYANDARFAYGAAISNAIVFISILLIVISKTVGALLEPSGEEE